MQYNGYRHEWLSLAMKFFKKNFTWTITTFFEWIRILIVWQREFHFEDGISY